MILSVFLAKLIGLYLIIIALIWMFRKKQFETISKEIFTGQAMLLMSGAFSLLFGLAIVIDHSIWELNWRGLITVFGYLSIVKGILRLAFPAQMKKISTAMFRNSFWMIIILLLVGVYLTYNGFMTNMMMSTQ